MLLRLTQKEDQWLAENTDVADWGIITDPNGITSEGAIEILGCIVDTAPRGAAQSLEGRKLVRRLAAFVARYYPEG